MSAGVLVVNLGTPDAPDIASVRRYLNEFLMDPYVVTLPWPARRLLVSAFILPFRPKRSAEAYTRIWTSEGSPLMSHSIRFTEALAAATGLPCVLGMRYGTPSLQSAVDKLLSRGVREIRVLLMYPQHADSTRSTSIEVIRRCIPSDVSYSILQPFFERDAYISCLAGLIRGALPGSFDHLLLSYHGLPEEHLRRADPTGKHCLASATCCETSSVAHATCYRHQVRRTSALLGQALGLSDTQLSVSFQSRLGRQKWLDPYTDQILTELPSRGVKHLAVACPAFVVDNLETLEEIGMQGRETYLRAGGKTLTLIPCLNSQPEWVTAVARWCTNDDLNSDQMDIARSDTDA